MAQLLSDLTAIEKLSLIEMSYSRVDTFSMCQAKYFFNYVLKERGEGGEAAMTGTVVHAALEDVIEKDIAVSEDTFEDLKVRFDAQRDILDTKKMIGDEFAEIAVVMMSEFVDRHKGEKFPVLEKEMNFEIVIGGALVRGFIDRVDYDGETIRITDYKTGKWEVTKKSIPTNMQLGIYAIAMNLFYPDTPIYGELYYLRSGKQKGHHYSSDDLIAIEQKVVEAIDEVRQTSNFQTTANSRICSFCDFQKNGMCAVGRRRVRR